MTVWYHINLIFLRFRILTVAGLLISMITAGQEYYDNLQDTTFDDIAGLNLTSGCMLYQNPGNYGVNSFSGFQFNKPIQNVGISLCNTYVRNSVRLYGFRISFSQNIQQEVKLKSDSTVFRAGGGNFSILLVGYDLTPKSEFSSVLLGYGFNTGRLIFRSSEYRSQKNPYFAPAIFLDPKFFFGHLSIAVSMGYQWDISNKKWKDVRISDKTKEVDLPRFNQSGLMVSFGIGWRF